VREGRLVGEQGVVVADPAWWAETARERGRGLLGLPPLKPGQALLIPTRGVHTFGMAYALDLLYLTRDFRVVETVGAVGPGRIAPLRARTRVVVELPAGSLARLPHLTGMRLRFEEPRRPTGDAGPASGPH